MAGPFGASPFGSGVFGSARGTPSAPTPGPPSVLIEVAFSTDPASATPVWTDVTAYVKDLTFRTGRQFELDRIVPGALSMTLDNADRRFDPSYTAGAYYPNVLPMRRVRVSGIYGGTTYQRWNGYVERWPVSWAMDTAFTVVTATDGFLPLQQALLVLTRGAEQSGARIAAVLDAVGWPAADRVIDAGQSLIAPCAFVATDGQTALQHLLDVADTERGIFFCDGQGRAVFHDRHRRLKAPYLTSNIIFTDSDTVDTSHLQYRDLVPSFDADHLYNDVRCTAVGGVTQAAADATSQTRYFRRTLNLTPLLSTDNEALDQTAYLLALYKDPLLRFDQIVLDAFSDDHLWPQVLGRELSDRVTVVRTPSTHPVTATETITKDVLIEAATHTVTPSLVWTTVYQLSPPNPVDYWVLDTSALDGTAVVGY